MKDNQFSVHKSMVLSNRKALALYLFGGVSKSMLE